MTFIMDEEWKVCRFCHKNNRFTSENSDFCDKCGMKLSVFRHNLGFKTKTANFEIKVGNNIRKVCFSYGRVFEKLLFLHNSFIEKNLYYKIEDDVLTLFISDGLGEEKNNQFTTDTFYDCVYSHVKIYKMSCWEEEQENLRCWIRDYRDFGEVYMPDSTEYDCRSIVRWMILNDPYMFIKKEFHDDFKYLKHL